MEIIETHKKDRRKNNIGDRCKHLAVQFDVVEKEFQLIKADLSHLINDIYGLKKITRGRE